MSLNTLDTVPNEIWSKIFSYLDKKSLHTASATCKFWLELIRTDSKLSSYIILQNIDLENLQRKIEKFEWIWERWPVLKSLELENSNVRNCQLLEEALESVQKINFEGSASLEKIIFSVAFEFTSLFKDDKSISRNSLSKLIASIVQVKKLSYNPANNLYSFGLEHIFCMKMFLLEVPCTSLVYDTLKLIGERAESLANLTINISNIEETDLQLFENGLTTMFSGLKNSLKTLTLNNMNQSSYGNAVLRAVVKGCPNLLNLNMSILHNYELKNYEIADVCQKLKNLRKCHVRLKTKKQKGTQQLY